MRAWIVACVLAAGCGPLPTDLYLGFPPSAPDDVLVFSLADSDGRRLTAVSAASAPDFVLRIDESLATLIEVLVYPAGALPLGPLATAPATEIGRPLPEPDDVFELLFDREARWREKHAPSEETADLRLKLCEFVSKTSRSWEVRGFVRVAVPVDETAVLFAASDATFGSTFVSDGGEPTEIGGRFTGSLSPLSAWRGPGDRVWVGDLSGRISSARITRAGIVDDVEEFDFGFSRVDSMDGHIADDGSVEIFAASSGGRVAHYDGTIWTLLDGRIDIPDQAVIMWRAPGEAVVAATDTRDVQSVVNGELRGDEGPPGNLYTVRFVPGVGEVAGLQSGEFYARGVGESWRSLGPSFSVRVLAIEPTRFGFDYLLASGRVGRYHHPHGFCPNEGAVPVLGFAGVTAPLGDDLFIAGELNAATGRSQGGRVVFEP